MPVQCRERIWKMLAEFSRWFLTMCAERFDFLVHLKLHFVCLSVKEGVIIMLGYVKC